MKQTAGPSSRGRLSIAIKAAVLLVLFITAAVWGSNALSPHAPFLVDPVSAQEKPKDDPKTDPKDDPKDGDRTHMKEQTPTATPTSTPEPARELTPGEKFAKGRKEITNPQTNEDVLKNITSADLLRKIRTANAELTKEGKGEIDFVNGYDRGQLRLQASLHNFADKLGEAVDKGLVSPDVALGALAHSKVAAVINAGQGYYLSNNARIGGQPLTVNWDPGKPNVNPPGEVVPNYFYDDFSNRTADAIDNFSTLVSSDQQTVLDRTGSKISKFQAVELMSMNMADASTVMQGNWGSCWTCPAVQMLWAWRPDQMSSAMNQLLFTGQFVSPFNPNVKIRYSDSQLSPTNSNLMYNIRRAGQGEQSYIDMLGQRLVGNLAGNSAPWNGGYPGAANNSVYWIGGISGVPYQSGIGGLTGLMNEANNGTLRTAGYGPFSGHWASNSGRMVYTTKGEFVGMMLNDNSWGQSGEIWMVAKPENLSRMRFPGGGGSAAGGFGEMGAGLLKGLSNMPQPPQQQPQKGNVQPTAVPVATVVPTPVPTSRPTAVPTPTFAPTAGPEDDEKDGSSDSGSGSRDGSIGAKKPRNNEPSMDDMFPSLGSLDF